MPAPDVKTRELIDAKLALGWIITAIAGALKQLATAGE